MVQNTVSCMSNDHRSDDLAARLEKAFTNAGYVVTTPNDLLRSIDELFTKPSVEEVIAQELPLILASDPQFFLRHQINLGNIAERLSRLYGEGSPIYRKIGDKAVGDAVHAFKVVFRHVRFFMIDHPDKESLQEQVDDIKKILRGEYFDEFRAGERKVSDLVVTAMDVNDMPIPNILNVRETDYPRFASFDGTYGVVRNILPFVKEPEARRIAVRIHSHAGTLSEKALFAKTTIQTYLQEARSVIADRTKPVPGYYDTAGVVYNTIIKPARDARHV